MLSSLLQRVMIRLIKVSRLNFLVGGTIYVDAFEVKDDTEFGAVSIQVKDSGVGIAKENLHKVFKEIVQFDANKNQGGGGKINVDSKARESFCNVGSGIGLWISKKIVDLHGGIARVHSEGIGHGCTFEICIPITAEAKAFRVRNRRALGSIGSHKRKTEEMRKAISLVELQSSLAPLEEEFKVESARVLQRMIDGQCLTGDEPTTMQLPAMHSLIVDDSKLNRKFMARLLLLFDMSVEEAEDGSDCLEKVGLSFKNGRKFDAVFMDNNMPNMNGMEATMELRKIGYSGVIIGVTGDGRAESIREFVDRGADDVLVKPITNDQLRACILDCLTRREAVQ